MAKVYFYYSAMNAGKSTVLLQSSYNYQERGMRTLIFAPAIDNRAGLGRVKSRIGLEAPAEVLNDTDQLFDRVKLEHDHQTISCVLIDESQFLTATQVDQCTDIADTLNIPVLCYGLRTDFLGHLFPGSARLLAVADHLVELKTICHCGRKATMNLRLNAEGKALHEGAQVEIGGNERYVAVCRAHFKEALASS